MTQLLALRGVSMQFGAVAALTEVDFDVPRQAVVSLIGPNGAGKTTLFNTVAGVFAPRAGSVEFAGVDITGRPPHVVTKRGIGRTFQQIRLFNHMSAVENVLVGMYCRPRAGTLGAILGSPKARRLEAEARARAMELLAFCGLTGRQTSRASHLSYGDQRRLEVARALATGPQLLMLDEPTAGMNPNETSTFSRFVHQLREEQGLSVLLIEHDMRFVMGVSERVTVLDRGQKIAEGPPTEIQENEAVIEAYLGRSATRSWSPP